MNKKQLQIIIPILTITLSLLVIVAWFFEKKEVLSIIPDAPSMKFNTALLFILISFSILFLGNKAKLLNQMAIYSAIATFFISSLTLLQYVFKYDLGIDNLFAVDSFTENNAGRMSFATAFCFMMLSLAKILRLINKKDSLKFVNYLVTMVAIISLLVTSTYLLQFISKDYVLIFNSMAIHTAVLLFLASLAISLKHPDHSYVGFLTGKYVGSKQARSLLPIVVGLPIILNMALLYSVNLGLLETDYGVALHTITYAIVSLIYFSVIFTRLNKADKERFELEENLRATNQELNQYKLALDQSSIVCITDTDGTITYVNKKFIEVSGYSQEETIGHTHKLVNSGHHPDSFFRNLWQTINKGSVWIGGVKNKTKSGDFYWVHMVIVPIRSTNGDIIQFLSIKQDITKITVLSNQYENLKLRNKEIEQFTYIASHDLQEPLRSLNSIAKLLHKGYANQIDSNGEKMINFISSAASRMSEMVKGLLDYSIIGINKELKKVDTSVLVEEVKKDISKLIKSANASVLYSDLPRLNVFPTELRLLFQNLIQNAIKFNTPGVSPIVFISSIKEQGYYKFCVKDNGIGISQDQLTTVFALFKRLHNKRAYSGTGIGLAHCEKIVHLHGGTIWVESELGNGSSFFFTIPII